jgi:hypothetical protein
MWRRRRLVWIAVGALVAVGLAAFAAWRPACRELPELRSTLLRDTPPGTDSATVLRALERRRWPAPKRTRYYILPAERGTTGLPILAGETTFTVDLPNKTCLRTFPFSVWINVRWGLDSLGRVVDIDLKQSVNGL